MKYKHGRVETYNDPRHHGLSYQHRDDGHGTCPLPEHGSHTQGQHTWLDDVRGAVRAAGRHREPTAFKGKKK